MKRTAKLEYKIIEKIDQGGSDRIFYRCLKGSQTYILVWDLHVEKYVRLQKHLHDCGVAVPKIHWVNEKSHLVLIEDLGKDSLFSLFKKKRGMERLYRLAINELLTLQLDGWKDAPVRERYDHANVRWEQEYFKKHFLLRLCNVSTRTMRELDSDFESLADEFIQLAKPWKNFLMHRDYQSQNIYVKAGKIRIIDFQSARIGPFTYDLAALLRDPYVRITRTVERKLVDYYRSRLSKRRINIKKKDFLHLYQLSCLQRNMQALGAFVNLSFNKEKLHFKQYIPRGIDLLRRGLKDSRFAKLTDVLMNVHVPEDVI
jgi:aminoglycoside/choline kinase family phosphotransferase